jgi:hypothetical protein
MGIEADAPTQMEIAPICFTIPLIQSPGGIYDSVARTKHMMPRCGVQQTMA